MDCSVIPIRYWVETKPFYSPVRKMTIEVSVNDTIWKILLITISLFKEFFDAYNIINKRPRFIFSSVPWSISKILIEILFVLYFVLASSLLLIHLYFCGKMEQYIFIKLVTTKVPFAIYQKRGISFLLHFQTSLVFINRSRISFYACLVFKIER